jgi:hypothetical protein
MRLLDIIGEESISKLSPFAQRLIQELRPLIESLDPSKIGNGSKIEISPLKDDWSLNILIEPKDSKISPLDIYASKSQCILGYAESEQIECHTDPASDSDSLIRQVVNHTAKYLNGVTVIGYYNRKNKLFMKKYYYGIDTENDGGKLIGTWRNVLWFFSKVHATKKNTYKFTKS